MPPGPEAVEEEGTMETLRLRKNCGDEILLEEDCPRCHGHGEIFSWRTKKTKKCKFCGTKGVVLTEAGETILEFMKKYGETK